MTISRKKFLTALAPMRDITNRQFCNIFTEYGEPDFYISEFLRVHSTSKIDNNIYDIINNRKSKHPLFIQLLGREPKAFVNVAKSLQQYNISGIDLNFGCPMPKIYKKGSGGALLNEPYTIEKIISSLKENITLPISSKIRVGFSDDSNYNVILKILDKYELANVTIHARTVKGLYREPINYNYIKQAKQILHCSVLANGNIDTAKQAYKIFLDTKCDGVMIGRAAIRNPYIFHQINSLIENKQYPLIKLKDIEQYIYKLMNIVECSIPNEKQQICSIKKYLNFIGQCIDDHGEFLYHMRRSNTKSEMLKTINLFIHSKNQEMFHENPYFNVLARPNCE